MLLPLSNILPEPLRTHVEKLDIKQVYAEEPNNPPQIEQIAPITKDEGKIINLEPTVTDPDGDPVTITYQAPFDASGSWQIPYNFTGSDSSKSFSTLITASDGKSSSSITVNITVNNVNAPPQVHIALSSYSVNPNTNFTIYITSNDPDGDTLSYELKQGTRIINVPPSLEVTDSIASTGTYQYTITATDSQGLSATDSCFVEIIDPSLGKDDVFPVSGDFNGDGLTDIGTFTKTTGEWKIALSNKGEFNNIQLWLADFKGDDADWTIPITGDFNKDGLTDIALYDACSGKWKFAFSNGSAFIPNSSWDVTKFGASYTAIPIIGDFNGDGITDVGYYDTSNGQGWIKLAKSDGTGFRLGATYFETNLANSSASVGDFNGDGLADIVAFKKDSGEWRVILAQDILSQEVINWAVDPTNIITGEVSSNDLAPTPTGARENVFDGNDNTYWQVVIGGGAGRGYGFTYTVNMWVQSEFLSPRVINHIRAKILTGCPSVSAGGGSYTIEAYDGGSWKTVASDTWSKTQDIVIDKNMLQYENVTKIKISQTAVTADAAPRILVLAGIRLCEFSAWGPGNSLVPNAGLSAFTSSTSWLTGFGTNKDIILEDYNHDGKTDIGYFDKATGEWHIALSDGTRFIEQSGAVWPSNFGAGSDNIPSGGDFNGDGIGDAAVFHKTGQGLLNKWEIKLHNSKQPDLLTSITNGIGGKTTIAYGCSTAFDNTGGDGLPDLPFPVDVVSEITQEDGLGSSYNTSYVYKDGFFEPHSREFRGFGYVRVIDAEGSIKETYFNQDDIKKGRPQKEAIRDKYERLYSETLYNWQSAKVYNNLADFPYLGDTTSNIYNAITGESKSSQTFYTYDNYGNASDIKEEGFLDVSGDEKETSITYNYDTTKWILSLPSMAQIKDSTQRIVSAAKYTYDSQGALIKNERWLGAAGEMPQWGIGQNPIIEFTYDDYGNAVTVTDARGNITQTTYDLTKTFPLSIRNQLGHIQQFTYDNAIGKIKTSTDPNGQIATSTYDSFGRLINITSPGNISQISYTYDLTVVPTKITTITKVNATSSITAYNFIDGLGRRVSSRIQAEYQNTPKHLVNSEVKYDSRGQIIAKYLPYYIDVPNPEDKYLAPSFSTPFASYEYDAIGRLIKIVTPDNKASYVIYGVNTIETVNENNQKVKQVKDAYGRSIEVQEADASITNYSYDASGNLTDTYDSASPRNHIHIDYDTLGRKISMQDPDMGGFVGKSWTYAYDKLGNLISQTNAKDQTITFQYDEINRLVSKSTGVTYIYDQGTNSTGRLSKVTDSSGSTEFFYDILGREIKAIKTINGTSYTIERTYDSLNKLITVKYPDNTVLTYVYNKQGGIETVTGSGDKTYVSSVEYNANGQIEHIVYGNGTATTYTYNPYHFRLEHLQTINSQQQTIQDSSYNFDPIGNVASILDSKYTNTQHFEYDNINRLIQATGTSYGQIDYQYDSIGNMLKKGDITMEYGQGAGPHAVTAYTLNATRYPITYDTNGNMTQKGANSFSYDTENRLTKVTSQHGGGTGNVSIDLTEGWNFISFPIIFTNNNISNVLSSIQGKYDQVSKYDTVSGKWKYYVGNDKFNQFNTMEYGEGYLIYANQNCTLNITGTFPITQQTKELKIGWNLITAPTDSEIAVTDALKGITYTRIAEYNGNGYAYDPTTFKKGKSYWVYVASNQIWNIPLPKSETIYTYDGDGGRLTRQTADKTNIYLGSSFELEGMSGQDADKITKHIFMGSIRVCSVENTSSGEHTYYYHQDHIGSSNIITDEAGNGNVVNVLEYSPYGEVSRNTGTYSTDKRFTGKTWDASSELYYYGARYYDPEIGRFTQADTIVQAPNDPQSLNRYSYCRNNPINYTDPTGNKWSWNKFWHNVVAGIAAGIVAALATPLGPTIQGMLAGMTYGAIMGGFEGGWKGALIGGTIGASAGAYIGMGVNVFGPGFAAAALGASVIYTAATEGAEGLGYMGGGMLGGILGYQVTASGMSGWQKLSGSSQKGIDRNALANETRKLADSLTIDAKDMEVRMGSRSVANSPFEHGFVQKTSSGDITEMGPGYDGLTKVFRYNPNNPASVAAASAIGPTPTNTMDALASGQVRWSNPTMISSSAFESMVSGYEQIWSGAVYAAGSFNSNYAANTWISGSGGSITGLTTWRPTGIFGRHDD